MTERPKKATPTQISRALSLIDELIYTEDFHVSLANMCQAEGYDEETVLGWMPREAVQHLIRYLRQEIKNAYA